MKKHTVNIVAVKDSWILEDIANKLSGALNYALHTEEPTRLAKITYYINYAQSLNERVSQIECGLFTHIEERSPELTAKWWRSADQLDVAICMSKIYAKSLKGKRVVPIVIPPGVDLDSYTLKPIRIGVVGRVSKRQRKGEDLIAQVQDIPHIEWCFTSDTNWPGGNAKYISSKDMPAFFHSLDYLLVASRYEGGPMPVVEALASGVPVIASRVGWVPELPHTPFKVGDAGDLRKVLEKIVNERVKLRRSVEDRSWNLFIEKHDRLFKNLALKPGVAVNKRFIKSAVNRI